MVRKVYSLTSKIEVRLYFFLSRALFRKQLPKNKTK